MHTPLIWPHFRWTLKIRRNAGHGKPRPIRAWAVLHAWL